ncbi:hypothetical protein NW761_007584 [Fusarium oxysporum]|nr:hypothetical protein NW763_010188 [Fusarium oxysporum]KAJ4047357.1 hypothetical protein NW758_005709 [Fusarium oxysporum]KAJ4047878.1 hypothetical protein NW753_008826 [Fusarium oxysporum]KAJ4089269.1 hypothetical protein NW761_007584 [Fusarium oxysporum]KAJ4093345.1 hypothetical protein NW756_005251 [Fusarium oxysporum]
MTVHHEFPPDSPGHGKSRPPGTMPFLEYHGDSSNCRAGLIKILWNLLTSPLFFSLDERTSMISSLNHETTQPQAIAVTDSPPHELAHSIDQVDQTNWDPAYHR